MNLLTFIKNRSIRLASALFRKDHSFAKAKSSGFTLVEAMVAISILSISVTAPLVIAQKGIASAIYSRDQITAFYLAQEAVEYIRNIRDTNRITESPWLNGLTPCIKASSNETCKIDVQYTDPLGPPLNPQAIMACAGSGCGPILINNTETLYGYGSGWTPTKFTRTIQIENTPGSDEALIAVSISWSTNLFTPIRTFTVREYIFNY